MKKFLFLSLCAFSLFHPSITANASDHVSSDDHSVSLGELLISPYQIPGVSIEESRFPGNATVLTEPEIAASGALTVTDLLAQQEGVSLMDSKGFGLGADTGLTLRGFNNSSRTNALVLVDGVRQNRITGDEVHWQAIPMEQIERIEILRGGAGTIYGEGALSGVINITTKKGGLKPIQFEGSAEAGSYEHYRASSVVRGTQKAFSYSAGVTRALDGGYRDHTDSRATTLNFSGGWTVCPQTQLDVHVMHHEDTTGFAGGLTQAQVQQDRRNPGSFFGFFDEKLDNESLQLTQKFGESWTAAANLFLNNRDSDSVTTSRFAAITSTKGANVRASNEMSGNQWKTTTVFGTELTQDKAVTGSRTGGKSESNRIAYGLFIEEVSTFFEKLSISLGIRYDRSHYEEDLQFPTFMGVLRFQGSSPKVGISYEINDQINLFSSLSRSFKAPNIDDLDAVLPPFVDSADVKPQRANHFEAGIRYKPARWLHMEATGFIIHTKDEILFNPFTFANANYPTQRKGIECGFHGQADSKKPSYYLTYSLTEGRFSKGTYTGYELPGIPRHRVTAGVRCPVTKNFSGGLDFLWVGHQFRINDFNNQFPARPYSVFNGRLDYLFHKIKFNFSVFNLLNKKYETFPSSTGTTIGTGENPAPPRTWVAGASWEF